MSEPAKDALPPFLQFKVPSARQGEDESIGDFQGAGGCNRFLGSYWLRGAALQLKLQTSSVRLCLEGGKDEPAYLQALTEVTGYAQKGRELVLRGKEGKPVLRFKAEETGEPPYEPWDPPMQPA